MKIKIKEGRQVLTEEESYRYRSYNVTDKLLIGVYIVDYNFIFAEIKRPTILLFSKFRLYTHFAPPLPLRWGRGSCSRLLKRTNN